MKKRLLSVCFILALSFFNNNQRELKATAETSETIEYYEMIINTAKNNGNMVETLTLADYAVMHGDAKYDNVLPFTNYTSADNTATLGLTTDDAHADVHWRIKSVHSDGVIAMFSAKEKINIDIIRSTIGGDWTQYAQIEIYKKSNDVISLLKEVNLNGSNPKEDFGYNDIVLETGESLYYQFIFRGNDANDAHRTMINLPKFVLKKYSDNSSLNPPIEDETLTPTDYLSSTSIDLSNLAIEVALRNGDCVKLKDMEVNLLQGNIFTTTKKFENYIISNNNGQKNVLISDVNEFNSPDSAAFETWRINTTNKSSAIFEIKATSDIKLSITHPAINNGWIDNSGQYFGLYIKTNDKIYTQFDKPITSATSTENEYGGTLMLKKGDICYYVFGSIDGFNRNVEMIPLFSASTSSYDETIRNEQLTINDEKINMWDALSATINNNYEDVDYNLFSYGFYYGNIKEPIHFNYHVGDGSGSEKDALWDSAIENTGFLRWQMQCSDTKDAIMKITAKENVKISISHPEVWQDAWSTHTAIKYYAVATDNTRVLLKDIPILTGTNDTYFALDVHLKKSESLYIVYYTTNESYGSINFRPTINASCKDFDETKIIDYETIRTLNTLKNTKVSEINDVYESLNEDDYSISNWGKITNYVDDFLVMVENIQEELSLNTLVNETINNINSIKTKIIEQNELNQYKQEKINELNELFESINKKEYSKENYESIKNKIEEFKTKVNDASTKTNIDSLMRNVKAYINKVEKKQTGCKGSVATAFLPLLSLISILLISFLKKEDC